MPGIKRKTKSLTPISNSASPIRSSSKSPLHDPTPSPPRKKKNLFKLLKQRETRTKINIQKILDTISFPFSKNKMTFYRIRNKKYIDENKKEQIIQNEYNIEALLKLNNIDHIYKLDIEKGNVVFETIHKIEHNSDNYHGQHYEHNPITDEYEMLSFDITGVVGLLNYLKDKSPSTIGNSMDIFNHLYCNKEITDLYYIDDEADVLTKLNIMYASRSISFEIKEERPPISSTSSGGGKSKKSKILYKKKIRTVYKNINNLKYVKFNNKNILLKDIKGKYKCI
jgi:hypothetical protein